MDVIKIKEALNMIGKPAKCNVTGFKGVITSVCFNQIGIAQALIRPKVGSDGKMADNWWLNIDRLDVEETPVLDNPFEQEL